MASEKADHPAWPREVPALDFGGGFTVRALRDSRDAIQVADCAYATYEKDFPLDIAYHPRKLLEANRKGTVVSIVAELADGNIVGHGALAREGGGDLGGEMCMGFVHPDFRRRGLLRGIADVVVRTAFELGLKQIYCGSVMPHIYSQAAAFSLGFSETGIKFGYVGPMSIMSMGIPAGEERVSVLVQTKRLRPDEGGGYRIPGKHRRILETLDRWRGESHRFRVDDPGQPPPFQAEATVWAPPALVSSYVPGQKYGKVEIGHLRSDCRDELRREITGFMSHGAECVNVLVPFETGIAAAVAFLEASGFFFGGIHPMRDGKDALLMQFLTTEVDITRFAFAHERCRLLAEYIDEQRSAPL